jgi:hypothetical protein
MLWSFFLVWGLSDMASKELLPAKIFAGHFSLPKMAGSTGASILNAQLSRWNKLVSAVSRNYHFRWFSK